MLEGAGASFDHDRVLAGQQTPVFFGSAVNNFGVELLLRKFLAWSAPPRPRVAAEDGPVPVDAPAFSGFVFKIQANMDPKHRDRIAFMRMVSGTFRRGMKLVPSGLGKPIAVVKVGSSEQAQAAAVAHSGSLAGEARVTDAALDAAGVIRCHDLDELLETAELTEGTRRTGRGVGRGQLVGRRAGGGGQRPPGSGGLHHAVFGGFLADRPAALVFRPTPRGGHRPGAGPGGPERGGGGGRLGGV